MAVSVQNRSNVGQRIACAKAQVTTIGGLKFYTWKKIEGFFFYIYSDGMIVEIV